MKKNLMAANGRVWDHGGRIPRGCLLEDCFVVLTPLELRPLLLLQVEDVHLLVCQSRVSILQVPDELAEALWLQGGCVVGALPGAILCEVALVPLGPESEGGDVDGNAEVVSRKADGLHTVRVVLLQNSNVKQADVLEWHRVARGAVVQHHTIPRVPLACFPKGDDLFDLIFSRHSCGDVHISCVLVAKHPLHFPMLVRGGPHLDEHRVQTDDLLCRRHIPHRAGVLQSDRLAVFLELTVVFNAQLEELAMLPIGGPKRIRWVRVRRIVLCRSEQLLRSPLLELPHCGPALLGEGEKLLGGVLLAFVIASDLRNDLRLPVLHRLEGGHVH
mmetsp:Transcript_4537/g.10199  ORF Transcript_4537/g.10199 Transcript_4537/m.10199 type:complete len:330 (-) Transcript_4537:113-1102(-)